MNKIDYILVMVLMVLLSGCNSLFDKEIPEYQVSDATAVTDQALLMMKSFTAFQISTVT